MIIRTNKGFTLVELMIVITIIGILVGIAIPSYQGYLIKAACEDAKATLVGAANVLERIRAQTNSYPAVANSAAALGVYAFSPVDGESKQMNIAITASTATSYTLTATPTPAGRLAGRGTLTLNSVGIKAATGDLANPPNDGASVQDVWQNRCAGL